MRAGAPRRFGPDLVHLGVLLLIAGGIITATARQEALFYMAEGDQVVLNREHLMTLRSFRFDRYPDGRPRDWVSTVEVARGHEGAAKPFAIEVNRPLRVGGLKVLQTSYGREARATLADSSGSERLIRSTGALRMGQRALVLAGIEEPGGRAIFEEWEGRTRTRVLRAAVSEKVGEYVVRAISEVDVTGLKVVHDPGFAVVVAAVALVATGLSLAAIQKARDGEV